jgi:hypothetical protein
MSLSNFTAKCEQVKIFLPGASGFHMLAYKKDKFESLYCVTLTHNCLEMASAFWDVVSLTFWLACACVGLWV